MVFAKELCTEVVLLPVREVLGLLDDGRKFVNLKAACKLQCSIQVHVCGDLGLLDRVLESKARTAALCHRQASEARTWELLCTTQNIYANDAASCDS